MLGQRGSISLTSREQKTYKNQSKVRRNVDNKPRKPSLQMNVEVPKHFLTSNSTTNLPFIRFNREKNDFRYNDDADKENNYQHINIPGLIGVIVFTNDCFITQAQCFI